MKHSYHYQPGPGEFPRARAYALHVSIWTAAWLIAPPHSSAEGWAGAVALIAAIILLAQLWVLRDVRYPRENGNADHTKS